MRDNTRDEPDNQTTIHHIREIARRAADPAAPEAERAAAALRVSALLALHGFTEEDLKEKDLDWRRFSPRPLTESERSLAIHIPPAVRFPADTEMMGEGELLEVEATSEEWAEITAIWKHLLPQFRRCWQSCVVPEEKRLKGRGRELEELHKNAVRAFIGLARIFPDGQARNITAKDLEAGTVGGRDASGPDNWRTPVLRLARLMTVEPWRDPAVPSQSPPHAPKP